MLSHANGTLHLLPPPPTEGKDSCTYGLPALEYRDTPITPDLTSSGF